MEWQVWFGYSVYMDLYFPLPILLGQALMTTILTIHFGEEILSSRFEYCDWPVGCYFAATCHPVTRPKKQIRSSESIVNQVNLVIW